MRCFRDLALALAACSSDAAPPSVATTSVPEDARVAARERWRIREADATDAGLPGALESARTADGHEARVVASPDATQLVLVDPDGTFRVQPPPARAATLDRCDDALTPQLAAFCRATLRAHHDCDHAEVEHVAASADVLVALVIDGCTWDDYAPLRIDTYRWPGPVFTERQLPSQIALGLRVSALAVSDDGAVLLAGPTGDASAAGVVRVDAKGASPLARVSAPRGNDVDNVLRVLAAPDGALWMLFDFAPPGEPAGGRMVTRDGMSIEVRDASGQPLQPTDISRDDSGEIVITAVVTPRDR